MLQSGCAHYTAHMKNWYYVHFCLFVNSVGKKTGFIWIHKLEMKLLCKDIKEICSYATGVLEEKVNNFTEKNKLKTITRHEEGSSWRFGLVLFFSSLFLLRLENICILSWISCFGPPQCLLPKSQHHLWLKGGTGFLQRTFRVTGKTRSINETFFSH